MAVGSSNIHQLRSRYAGACQGIMRATILANFQHFLATFIQDWILVQHSFIYNFRKIPGDTQIEHPHPVVYAMRIIQNLLRSKMVQVACRCFSHDPRRPLWIPRTGQLRPFASSLARDAGWHRPSTSKCKPLWDLKSWPWTNAQGCRQCLQWHTSRYKTTSQASDGTVPKHIANQNGWIRLALKFAVLNDKVWGFATWSSLSQSHTYSYLGLSESGI